MNFECRVRHEGAVTVVRPCGQMDSGETDAFQAELMKALDRERPRVVLDLEELAFVSSAGLRVLLLGAKAVERKAGLLLLCSLKPQIAELLHTAGFDRFLEIRDTRPDAVAEAGSS